VLPRFGRIYDYQDFYSPKKAKELGFENSTQTAYQYFFIMDEAGCVTRVRTILEVSFDFVDGVQTNHRVTPIEGSYPYDW
jgi:hypothetical protein